MKSLVGVVTSTKMEKTVAVEVVRFKTHPLYQKRMKRKKKFLAHDEKGAKKGDKVKIQACRPLSKTKKWQVVEIIKAKKKHGPTKNNS